jgi:hypothetical protein
MERTNERLLKKHCERSYFRLYLREGSVGDLRKRDLPLLSAIVIPDWFNFALQYEFDWFYSPEPEAVPLDLPPPVSCGASLSGVHRFARVIGKQ